MKLYFLNIKIGDLEQVVKVDQETFVRFIHRLEFFFYDDIVCEYDDEYVTLHFYITVNDELVYIGHILDPEHFDDPWDEDPYES